MSSIRIRKFFTGAFILILFLFTAGFSYSQSIRMELKDGYYNTPIKGSLSFIIDPVDSTVMACDVSDSGGFCRFYLWRPLKGKNFILKTFATGYPEFTVYNMYYQENRKELRFSFNVDPRKGIELFTVDLTKKVFPYWKQNPLFDSIPLTYYKHYRDTAQFYQDRAEKSKKKYELEELNYKREAAIIDSLQKQNPQLSYMPPYVPYPPQLYGSIQDLDCSRSFNKPFEVEGGLENFFKYFEENKKFIANLKKHKELRAWINFKQDSAFYMDTLIICIKNNGRIKSLKKLSAKILKKNLKWAPAMLNGKQGNLNKQMIFYIDFVYRKD